MLDFLAAVAKIYNFQQPTSQNISLKGMFLVVYTTKNLDFCLLHFFESVSNLR